MGTTAILTTASNSSSTAASFSSCSSSSSSRPRKRHFSFSRPRRSLVLFLILTLTTTLLAIHSARHVIYDAYTLLSLPYRWSLGADEFYISPERDSGFDLTFESYDRDQLSAAWTKEKDGGSGSGYEDKVPAVLHHISLSGGGARGGGAGGGTGDGESSQAAKTNNQWAEVRQSCLDMHPGWKVYLWDDEAADEFVRAEYPGLYGMWKEGYRYGIQRIDALRYLVLFRYGGMGHLGHGSPMQAGTGTTQKVRVRGARAHPTGFSIGFMMASKGNEFVGQLVENLERYNRRWLGLPYPTVMFSTGCHYASTIHALQSNRTQLKILSGTRENPRMHSLNGPVSTPIFNHLGSSSWHSYDAALIVSIGKAHAWRLPLMMIGGSLLSLAVMRRIRRRRLLKM